MSQTDVKSQTHNIADHNHHWRIEEANGPTSRGYCRLCGEVREFRNWLPEMDVTTRTERELAA